MKKHYLRKILALAIAVMIVCSFSASAFAQTYSAVSPTATVNITKYLTFDGALEKTPAATFSFTVAPGTAADATGTTPRIEAGTMVGTGDAAKPSIPNAVFSSADGTYTSVQTGDTLTLASGKQYAKKVMTVDFTGVTFSAPGIYRYVVTEHIEGDAQHAQGLQNGTPATRFMDVYVEDNSASAAVATLAVTAVVFHNEVSGITNDINNAKNIGFSNSYVTTMLKLAKTVTGNQGDRAKKFDFSVEISNGIPGASIQLKTYTVSGATSASSVQNLTLDANGAYTIDTELSHGDYIEVRGITPAMSYTITESDYASLGYATSTAGTLADANTADASRIYSVTAAGAADNTVTFTNARSGIVPTGIIMDVAPYALIVLLAGVAILLINRKKSGSKG